MSTDLSDRLSDHVFGGCVGGGEDSFGWLHGMGEVMECGLAVCKAVCCGAESFFFFFFFFTAVVCARGARGAIIRPRMYMNL